MKILILITRGDSIGGAQTHVNLLAKLFQKSGHDITVCYGGEARGPFFELLTASNINFICIPELRREISPFKDLKAIFHFRKIIKKMRPDVISLHSSKSGIIGRLAAVGCKIPVIYTVHGWAFTEGVSKGVSRVYKFIERRLSFLLSEIIVVSNYDLKIGLANKITDERKMHVIHNGIDITAEVTRVPPDSNSIANIVMVARFDQQKDHETLVKACINIQNICVHFLGDGPNQKFVYELAKQLNIADKFVFHGYTNKVDDFMRFCDIFVLISNWEGFPISTLEAMNFQLPVIISDVGGAKEAVVDGISGYIVGRKNIDELTNRLTMLSGDANARYKMGIEGRKLLLKKFSSQNMFEKTLSLYESTMKK